MNCDLHRRSAVLKSQTSTTSNKWLLWGLLASAGIVRIVSAIPALPNGLFDDGYITLRYAANLVQGFGLVFNPGERVLGTSSPLFAFILAAAAGIVGVNYLEALALTVGVFASLAMLYICDRILTAAELAAEVKWTYLAVLAFLPSFVTNATSGMETPVVLFLMSLSLYLCIRDRMTALAVVGVLLFLARVDTVIWLLSLGIHIVHARRRRRIRDLALPLVLFLTGVCSWLVFTGLFFGSVVPQSVVGKAVSHGAFVRPDGEYVLTFLSAFVPAQRFGAWGLALITLAFVVMLPAIGHLWSRCSDLRPIIYFFPLYVFIFLASHVPLFTWYFTPPKWAFYLLATYVLWELVSGVAKRTSMHVRPAYVMTVVSVFVFVLGAYQLRTGFGSQQPGAWLEISELIERNVQPEGRVFLEHIGLIGYRSGRYIYDYMGLVTPETTRLKREYGADWLPKAARRFDADVVVLYQDDIPAIASLTDEDAVWFQSRYRHVQDYRAAGLVISVYFR